MDQAMALRHLLTTCACLALLASCWTGCAAPKPVQTVEQGRRIDRATLDGFQRGVTTRQEVMALLGEPTTTVTSPADGSVTCSWDYVHTDAHSSIAIMTILTFGADGRLLVKMVSQSARKH
jgi:outer membrane protein assembly factor BamE (lipoprotein component of BamABCDE complex)